MLGDRVLFLCVYILSRGIQQFKLSSTLNMTDKSLSHITRKNPVVVNLLQTSAGYTVLEGNQHLNKTSTVSIVAPPVKQKPQHPQLPKKQNIIIPLYPYTTSKPLEREEKHITLPSCAAWFNFNSIHDIEKKALPEWFRNRKGATKVEKVEKFEKSEELYLKYRNYIVELGKDGYVSATRARKGLAGDACSIIRIHALLEHWGIINRYQLKGQAPNRARELIMKFDQEQKQDLFDYDRKLVTKSYNQEDGDLLRRTTKKYRPLCDFCTQRCGIVWFQHKRALNPKEIAQIMKTVNPKNPLLSTTEYQISLCLKCYSDGNFPIIFTSNDFNKITIEEKIEEANKNKKKKDKDSANNAAEVEWSLPDIDKMLSLVQKNGDDWEATAREFVDRTAEDVLLCFLTLPLKNVSKIKFENDATQFIKHNDTELRNNLSDNICVSAIAETKTQKMEVEMPKHSQVGADKEEYKLFEQIVRLELKRASLKMTQLEDWETHLQTEKRQIEEGRKNIVAEKLRALARQL